MGKGKKELDMEVPEEPMTFYPTLKEWLNMPKYVEYIESVGGHLPGIAKVVAPPEWQPDSRPKHERYNPSNMKSIRIESPIQQTIKPTPTRGAFESTSQRMPPLSVEKFVKLATSDRYVTPAHQSYEELEKLYWSYDDIDSRDDPLYGADVPGSLITASNRVWNRIGQKKMAAGQEDIFHDLGKRVTVTGMGSYLYFGMWKTTFSWHVEDMDLYGINLLHYGAPKSWYCVPPSHAYKLEAYARELFPHWSNACFNFLRHKVCMISPTLLAQRGIKVQKVVQEERDMIIVFPHAYHSGFNHGFNIAEASNFGMPRWVEHGKRYRGCTCAASESVVRVDMEPFIKRYQPELLSHWQSGLDNKPHPDDPQEIKELWAFCQLVLDKGEVGGESVLDISVLINKSDEKVEMENDQEEKLAVLKKLCRRQLAIFKDYRDILPEMKEIGRLLDPAWGMEEDSFESEEDEVWEVEALVDKRGTGDDVEYLVKWKDWDPSTNTWEPPEHLSEELILDYEQEIATDIEITSKMLTKAEIANVKVKKVPKREMQKYLDQLPEKEVKGPAKKVAKVDEEPVIVRKIGFADITAEELAAKKAMKKCSIKHKLWNCTKCSACIKPDCGKCWACKDKPKFGGRNIQKQKCQERRCSNPVVRGCDRCTWNI